MPYVMIEMFYLSLFRIINRLMTFDEKFNWNYVGNNPPNEFLLKGVPQICRRFTGEQLSGYVMFYCLNIFSYFINNTLKINS